MKKYIFNDNTKLIFVKDNFILIQNDKFKSKEKLGNNFYNKLLAFQENNKIITSPSETFSDNEIKFLKKNKIIKELSKTLEKYLNTQYEKYQIYLENTISNSINVDYIKNNSLKKILFVGAGGICTEVIDYLVSVGCNNFGFIDFDCVDITNFNRQFKYNNSDIGLFKVDALKRNLENQYTNLKISCFNKKIVSTDDLDIIIEKYKPDFIICAADTPIFQIQKFIVESCDKYNIPCIFGGVGQNVGSVGPLLYETKGRKRYLDKINLVLKSVKAIFPCKGSYGVTNSLIANYMANDIINFLIGNKRHIISLNKECEINFNRCMIYEKSKY